MNDSPVCEHGEYRIDCTVCTAAELERAEAAELARAAAELEQEANGYPQPGDEPGDDAEIPAEESDELDEDDPDDPDERPPSRKVGFFDPTLYRVDADGNPITYEQWRAARIAAGATVHDWVAVRNRYVEGISGDGDHQWPSLDRVADEFGITASTVRLRSSKEGWVAMRAEWQRQVEDERRRNRLGELAQSADKLDSKALSASELGLQLCVARLVEIGRAVESRRGQSGVDFGSAIEAREMQALASAADLWHKIGLRSVGDVEALRIQLLGANGKPLDVADELTRDNPERLGGVVAVLEAAGLGEFFSNPRKTDTDDDD